MSVITTDLIKNSPITHHANKAQKIFKCFPVLELGGFASQFATHFYRVANQFSKWFAVCESFYEGMDCIIIHLLLMPATRNKPVCN